MAKNNFLLGYGERLTDRVEVPSGGGLKKPPYDHATARRRVTARVERANVAFQKLPPEACPHDKAVAVLTVHPRYTSKSDFPIQLLERVGLRAVGSREVVVKPEAWGIKEHGEQAPTAQLFVAGQRSAFEDWSASVPAWHEDDPGAAQLKMIEDLGAFEAKDKVRPISVTKGPVLLEVVLHGGTKDYIVDAFEAFALKLKAKPDMDRRRLIGGLCFLPVKAEAESVLKLAQFSFLRVARGMPQIRPLRPLALRVKPGFACVLPTEPPVNRDVRVAVFDGGLPAEPKLTPWATAIELPGLAAPMPHLQEHGLAVTSAALFGPLEEGEPLGRPFAHVDHYRVLDVNSEKTTDPELYDILERICSVLDQRPGRYQYVNLSLGPDLPIEDHEVNVWTSELDRRFATPDALLSVAVGNTGLQDAATGLNRLQPPSDGVNALSVGASDSVRASWSVADYSSRGPGRCPGVMKPDGVAFGGSSTEPFFMLAPAKTPQAKGQNGTSFAAPSVLRAAVGVRACLGSAVSPLAIRALHIHRTEPGDYPAADMGWGRFVTDVDDLITCGDDEARVIYQGRLPAKTHLRARVPLPREALTGDVFVTATLCIAPEVDPEHAFTYTRSGLEVSFRPHAGKFATSEDGKQSKHAKTKAFFSPKAMYSSEVELREDGHKWEPCLHATMRVRASSLDKPCFDIYYHHRLGGMAPAEQPELPYALIVTVRAPKVSDLYNRVVRAHAHVLEALKPVIRVPIRTRT